MTEDQIKRQATVNWLRGAGTVLLILSFSRAGLFGHSINGVALPGDWLVDLVQLCEAGFAFFWAWWLSTKAQDSNG